MLLVRQTLGRAFLERVRPAQDRKKARLVETLTKILQILFPARQDIRRKMGMFVDQAVELANTMCEEKAWFFCAMSPAGEALNDGSMEITSDEAENKRVFMCTFPMFALRVTGGELAYLVKANVEHEGLFISM